ncbi:uncharacterized protein TNCV_4862771 [Trichonephila clavipes]|nr:uncharacterized protein TNCV_4862771 [Trichonephila clavipes]
MPWESNSAKLVFSGSLFNKRDMCVKFKVCLPNSFEDLVMREGSQFYGEKSLINEPFYAEEIFYGSAAQTFLATDRSTFDNFTAARSLSTHHRTSHIQTFFLLPLYRPGCGSPVVRVSDHGRYVMSSSPVPLKTRRVGQRCTLNLSRAETSSRWCGEVVRRGGASSGVVHVT